MNLGGKARRYSCEQVVPIEQEPRHHLVFENEFVRAFAVEIAPHDRTLCHHHPHDYLLYVARGAEIVSAAREEEPKQLSYRDGECELAQAGLVHVVENLSETPFRNVVVELLPAAGGLRRGGDPKRIAGSPRIVLQHHEERAAIITLEMDGNSEVEVSGPAIAVELSEKEFRSERGLSEQNSVAVGFYKSLDWIDADARELARGRNTGPTQLIVFQVGFCR
jgi:quercetin dioxygenase-like cupin family protein